MITMGTACKVQGCMMSVHVLYAFFLTTDIIYSDSVRIK